MKLLLQLSLIALRSLLQQKVRTALTMLGVIIGVGAVIVMVSIGQGAKQRIEGQIQGLGTNLLIIRPGLSRRGPVRSSNVETLTSDDAAAIARLPNVAAIAPEAGKTAQVKYLAANTSTTVLGTTEAWLSVNNFTLRAGRFIDSQDDRSSAKVAVLGATPAAELFEGVDPVGERIKIKGANYEVIGVLESKGQSGYRNPDDQIIVPLNTAQRRLFGLRSVRSINVQVATEEAMDSVQTAVEALLRERHRIAPGADPDFNIRNQKEIMETMGAVSDTFTALLAAVAAVSLLVGGIGIMNIMLVSVTERTREIGIRKAVGARRRDIMFQFLVESVVLSGLGGVVGIAAGVGVSRVVAATGTFQTAVSSDSIALAFGVSAGIGIFFGLYPARKAAQLDPIEALRHE
jgi:putative ABC transport system permease protein